MLRLLFAIGLALLLAAATMPARIALAPVATAAELPVGIPDIYVHVPRSLDRSAPAQVLLAVHGMGGNGEQFGAQFVEQADRNGWLLVAPTIKFGDWTDPDQIAREDPRLIAWLGDFIDHLDAYTGLPVKPRVLLLGHSRGAQLVHRFTLFEPRKVLAVAAVAAGTYTLPVERTNGRMVRFPYGLGDLQAVAGHRFDRAQLIGEPEFWIAVGSDDNNPAELPRAWDPYLGNNRVERARTFQAALHALGVHSVLVNFRGEGHSLTGDMAASACSFLRALDLAQDSDVSEAPSVRHATRVRGHF
jgi:pimeloyl-ACP methyl ester carboxylesterase